MGQLIPLRRLTLVDLPQCDGPCNQGRKKCTCGAGRLSELPDTRPSQPVPYEVDGPHRPSLLSRAWAYLWSTKA